MVKAWLIVLLSLVALSVRAAPAPTLTLAVEGTDILVGDSFVVILDGLAHPA